MSGEKSLRAAAAVFLLMLGCGGPLPGRAEDTSPSVAGLVGLGMDSGMNFSAPLSQAPLAFSIRYWASDRLGLDGLVAFLSQQSPQPVDAAGNTAPAADTLLGLGVGARWNVVQTSENVLVQFLARGSFVHGIHTVTDTPNAGTFEVSSLELASGIGVEAFLPFWPCLSLEASASLVLARFSGSSDLAFVPSSNSSLLGTSGKGFSPLQAGIHYYF